MTSTTALKDRVVFGFWVYLMSDCVLFASLFAVFAVLQGATFGAASAKELFSVPFVFIETLILLTSSFTSGLSLLAAYQNAPKIAISGLLITLGLGAAFISMEISEFTHLIAEGAGPEKSAFLSSFFALVGTHGLHVFLGSLWILVLILHIALRGLSEGSVRKLAVFTLFWHFLDVVWIFIFTFVYLLPLL